MIGFVFGSSYLIIIKWLSVNHWFIELATVLLIGVGWAVTYWLNKRNNKEQFVLQNKFQLAEKIINVVSKYHSKILELDNFIQRYQSDLHIEHFKNFRKSQWSTAILDISSKWVETGPYFIEIITTYENYKIALFEIDSLMKDMINKDNDFQDYFASDVMFNSVDFSNVANDSELASRMSDKLGLIHEKVITHLSDIATFTEGVQNTLLKDIFGRTISLRDSE